MSEKIINLELTEAEANSAIQLFDAAVKALGLQAAAPAMHLVGKLQKAANVAPLTPPTPAIQ